ncbi:enoyl-CoA hydratase-related protein [Geitlerinema splendidum]|nr:enoyl-CoA hydratase-related protein [Geitlerinema splendidum]
MDRPEVRNAFNDELINRLRHYFQSLPDTIRVVLLDGEGNTFSAGGDLNWMRAAANYTEAENEADALKLAELFQAIVSCHAVVIAKVHGAAFGGGCGLVCAADVAVASIGTKFSFSEVRLGLVPATISPFVIPKIGSGHARALFTTGEVFDDEKALRIGLIHDSVEPDQLHSTAVGKVIEVLRNGPRAVATSKWLAIQGSLPMEETAKILAKARSSEEGKEGVAAFLDKRPASFVEEVDRP